MEGQTDREAKEAKWQEEGTGKEGRRESSKAPLHKLEKIVTLPPDTPRSLRPTPDTRHPTPDTRGQHLSIAHN